MGQLTLAWFHGDTMFGLVAWIISTFGGGLMGAMVWHISTSAGRGNPYGVTAARALSLKLHTSYLDLCCLDTRTLPLSSLGITLCI